ncbi:MAG: 30S ribosomal protein S7 [Spirochaetes bacterium GWF1_41_5]|nr:MAG: 30S ribosomal protein S7 [Spirochaetes bacterium GWF1_41_5]HBE04488.1 30S ribosomal protein S7 [Spirochaetia bacterium]
MARRRLARKRERIPDPVFNSELISRFICRMMTDGKKNASEKIFYDSLKIIEEKTKKKGLDIFEQAFEKVRPVLEVRSRRVGGATYQVPVEVRPERRDTLAMRWIITYARERNEKTMAGKLAAELIDASNENGEAIKKKNDIFKMAESNKAFAHYKW